MSEKAILELPESVFKDLERTARENGTTPEEWIAERLRNSNGAGRPRATEEEIAAANARLRACRQDLGRAWGTDNEAIDADLAREYGDDHERPRPMLTNR
jgi:hypothetical protein